MELLFLFFVTFHCFDHPFPVRIIHDAKLRAKNKFPFFQFSCRKLLTNVRKNSSWGLCNRQFEKGSKKGILASVKAIRPPAPVSLHPCGPHLYVIQPRRETENGGVSQGCEFCCWHKKLHREKPLMRKIKTKKKDMERREKNREKKKTKAVETG